ncbi:aprataxin-like protein [Drosophila subobscura]|uniref:aprataxin-like protein n=1 Tax=Drosophila subobscura TaxID=7241 RepID=UPI00155A7FA4|nr:aprataxin-like protein [Drosophila subobscura]
MWRFNLIKEISDKGKWIISSDVAIVIADKYPKAQQHFLVLPKADISSIFELTREHLPLLEELHLLASNIVEVRGLQWKDFKVGFHAEPSLERLHLHVISQDFVSSCLKKKKHWNTYNTELFVPYEVLRDKLKAENSYQRLSPDVIHALLATPLCCNQCDFKPRNLPLLKEHLEQHLQNKSGQNKSVIYTKIETAKDKINKMDAKEKNEHKKEQIIQNIRNELKKKINDKEHILIESDQAVVVKADYPKAQYHFRVVAKADIADVTKLTADHLPLLDHMMDLAVQIMEKQDHVPSRNFRIGFKADPFWDRLNMHVISDDFYSMSMKRIRHWNSFNTELFMPFQQAYIMLSSEGAIEPISEEESEKLKLQVPLHCNQCDFESPLLLSLKAHLYTHWQSKEHERQIKKQTDSIVKLLDEVKLDDNAQPLPSAISEGQSQQEVSTENVYGPPINMMNQANINNPFRGTPPRFGIAAAAPPQRPFVNAPRHQRPGNPFARAPRPQQKVYPYGYAPRPQLADNHFGPPSRPYGIHRGNMQPRGPMPPRFSTAPANTVFASFNQQPRFAPNNPPNQRPRAPKQQQNQRPRAPNPQQNQGPRAPNPQQNQENPPQLTYNPNQTNLIPKHKPTPAANAGQPAAK